MTKIWRHWRILLLGATFVALAGLVVNAGGTHGLVVNAGGTHGRARASSLRVVLSGSTLSPCSVIQPLPRYSPTSIFNTRVDGASTAIDPSSSAIVGTLVNDVNTEEATHGGPWFNTTAYTVPVYTVPASQPKVPVTLDWTATWTDSLRAALASGVPIPQGAQPSAGTDAILEIWQPSTDTLWEFHKASLQSDGWHAQWGGVMTNVSQNPGYFSGTEKAWGASATAIAESGGLISPAEVEAGEINHALTIAIPAPRVKQFSWPAQRTDGYNTDPNSIPEGAWFRLDPSLNIASLNLPPFVQMLAEAAQKYGIIVRDKATNVQFFGEDPTQWGSNPWPSLVPAGYPFQYLAAFPWSHLQLLQMQLHSN